jgi:prepilin-type N-terminal cleavage/methylation domain-containing protein
MNGRAIKASGRLVTRDSESGLSLVEVLVAMTVAGALMLGGFVALSAGLPPMLSAGIRAREGIQLFGVHRAITRDTNALSPTDVVWELHLDPSGHGYELVRHEYREGQWSAQVMLDGVAEVDAMTGQLRLRSRAERWVDITARRLSEP